MTRKYFSLLLAIGLLLCFFSCAPPRERVEGGISMDGIYEGMSYDELKSVVPEDKLISIQYEYSCFMDEWGNTVLVCLTEDYQTVKKIEVHEKQLRSKRYLEKHLKEDMTVSEVLALAGIPTRTVGYGVIRTEFPTASKNVTLRIEWYNGSEYGGQGIRGELRVAHFEFYDAEANILL